MAAELITPTDELTGIPLPILPQEHLRKEDPNVNWHHAWHDNAAPQLQGLAGRALRHSRVQLVRMTDHNFKDNGRPNYHNFFKGPVLPESADDKFRLCVISAAGFVPDEAIDLRSGEPEVVTMSKEQLAILKAPAEPNPLRKDEEERIRQQAGSSWRSYRQSGTRWGHARRAVKEFRSRREEQAGFAFNHLVYQYEPMRRFFQAYVKAQDVELISESEIEEFLMTRNGDRKQYLGEQLLKLTVDQIADPVEAPYQQLRREGKLHPSMPPDAKDLVLYKLGSQEERERLAFDHAKLLGKKMGVAA